MLLKLAGPLQSWGLDSRFETRNTNRYPTKSAIIGMIAASLGYTRDQDQNIQKLNGLDFAVRIDQPGRVLRDYHIATKYKPSGAFERNYQTVRYYLQDAIFVVAVGSTSSGLIDLITDSIRNPYYQPFLGRRSCPINADYFIDVVEGDVIASISGVPWQAKKWYQKVGSPKLELFCDRHLLENNREFLVRDRVISFSQDRRNFGFRSVATTTIDVNPKDYKQQHDALSALGDSDVFI